MTRLRLWGIAVVVAVVALAGIAGVAAQGGPEEPQAAAVEVTVWRRVSNPSLLYVSTRPEGGSWRTLNTALDMSQRSDSGRFHQSNAIVVQVRLDDGTTVGVEVTVWRRISNPSLLYVSTRPEGGSWRTLNTALDMSQRSDSGRFHQSNAVLVDVPLPDPPPETSTAPDRSTCTIDEATAAKVIASTVQVITPTGTGSAFYIGNSEFVTAGHVVDHNPSSITLRNANISLTASLVGFYPFENGDVAILSASAPEMAVLDWAGTLAPGASVAVVGYPEGLGGGDDASITRGIVSRLFTQQGVSYLQTDAASSPGNSGGPLVDACGRVAGVVSSSYIGEGGSEGLHFAIAEPALARLLQRIRSGQSPPPVEQSPPGAGDPSEPTFWQIHAFINRVLDQWAETNNSIDALERPDYRRQQHNILLAFASWLTAQRSDPATGNSTASLYLETAIADRAALASAAKVWEQHAPQTFPALQAIAENIAATAAHQRASCDLWRLQAYSNAEDVCSRVAWWEERAQEAKAEAAEREAWEQVDSLIRRVNEHWGPTNRAISTLAQQWTDATQEQGAQIVRDQRDLAREMVSRLQRLRSDPATENVAVNRYLETAIAYWAARLSGFEVIGEHTFGSAEFWRVLQAANPPALAAREEFATAQCDLWRLQDYSNAEDFCTE